MEGFGIKMDQLPMMVAVKVGKRNRFAKLEGELAISSMGGFVDRILGGDMTFAALKPLPELEPAYLQVVAVAVAVVVAAVAAAAAAAAVAAAPYGW